MSLRIYVDAYSGYKANERPRQFCLDEDVFEIATVEDRWYDPNAEYFKVRTADGKSYLLRCDTRTSEWTLQSGFDGAELLARPSIEVMPVDSATIRRAEAQIAGCEQCREQQEVEVQPRDRRTVSGSQREQRQIKIQLTLKRSRA